jgi:hypothetical protein
VKEKHSSRMFFLPLTKSLPVKRNRSTRPPQHPAARPPRCRAPPLCPGIRAAPPRHPAAPASCRGAPSLGPGFAPPRRPALAPWHTAAPAPCAPHPAAPAPGRSALPLHPVPRTLPPHRNALPLRPAARHTAAVPCLCTLHTRSPCCPTAVPCCPTAVPCLCALPPDTRPQCSDCTPPPWHPPPAHLAPRRGGRLCIPGTAPAPPPMSGYFNEM